jgi:4-hydroxy-3-methylbut-2-en-1-yl diphosphate reductase
MHPPLQPDSKRSLQFREDESIEVTIAPNAGACFGVVRAIKLGRLAAGRTKDGHAVYSLGPLVHNPMTIDELKSQGLQIVHEAQEITQTGTVVLRSHGVKKDIEAELRKKNMNVVDATCPLVKKPQRIASSLGSKGYFLVLVGDPKHPEVIGVLSYFGRPDFLVTYDPKDVAKIPDGVEKIGIIAQTTIQVSVFDSIVSACEARFPEVAAYNTICDATSIRQSEAETLAQKSDVFIVVGGRNSSNTTKLVKICRAYQADTHLVETKEEIQEDWFVGKKKIAITGGASTPQDYVDEIGDYVVSLLQPRMR